MERVNDIVGRTVPRNRQLFSEARFTQDGSQSAARASQSQHPNSRRPMPEQRGQQGQQRPPYAPLREHAQNIQPPSEVEKPSRPQRRSYDEPSSRPGGYESYAQEAPVRRPGLGNNATYQPSRPPSPAQRIQPLHQRANNDYYADDYIGAELHADVIEEWEEEEEEEEEEHAVMRYGDWEEQDETDVIPYKRSHSERLAEPRTNYVPTYRETAQPTREGPARIPRDMSATRMPVSVPAQLVQPQHVRTQDVQRYRPRVTQPLDLQVMTEVTRERAHPSAEIQPTVRQTRQIAAHELLHPPIQAPQPTRPVCRICNGAGYLRSDVPFGHPNFGKPIACACKEAERKEKRRQQLRDMSNLDAFHNQVFKNFNTRIPGVQEAFQAARDFAENPYGWLLLIGPNGCGKTHLAAAIANQSLEGGAVVLFEAVPDLLDHLRAAFAPTASEVYDQLFSKMREAELLVLDDLGAQQSSPWANEKLFQLLNYRYNMGMPTVITGNPRGIQGVDERIRSRLSDNGLVASVSLDRACDYRPKQPRRR